LASKWSFNVWEFGLANWPSSFPLTKASRSLGTFFGGGIVTNLRNGVGQFMGVWLPGEALPENYQVLFFFPGQLPFPYGIDVEPDDHT
jgi:hypothetical protein